MRYYVSMKSLVSKGRSFSYFRDVGRPYMTPYETAAYTDLMPDGKARQFTFVMATATSIYGDEAPDNTRCQELMPKRFGTFSRVCYHFDRDDPRARSG